MINIQSLIPRHFVRTMAMHYLYAFHIHKEAIYQNSIVEIEGNFKFDVFSKEPINEQQLANEKNQALDYFKALEISDRFCGVKNFHKKPGNAVIDNKVWGNYQLQLTKEVNVLKNGLQAILNDILDAYLLTLKLVLEWFIIAKKQVTASDQLETTITVPRALSENPILEFLSTNTAFQNLFKDRKLTWNEDIHLVVRWYNQFIKNAEFLQHINATEVQNKDYEIVKVILQKIIWEQNDIQNYFENRYLGWEEIKFIVKNLWSNVYPDSILEIFQYKAVFIEPATSFYERLIYSILEKDSFLEELMQQYSKAWSLERLVLLDRVIIKLGLCEMHYLPDTPGKVVISEYVYLAKKYSTSKSLAFVNGMLDAVAKQYNFLT